MARPGSAMHPAAGAAIRVYFLASQNREVRLDAVARAGLRKATLSSAASRNGEPARSCHASEPGPYARAARRQV